MNISKEKVYNILFQQEPVPEEGIWELSLELPERPWTYKDVSTIQKKLEEYEDLEFYRDDDTLEIHTAEENMVLVIKGLPKITEYCNKEHFEGISDEWYSHREISTASIVNHFNLNMHSTVIKRVPIETKGIGEGWNEIAKYFYQKRNIGFIHKKTNVSYVFEMTRGSNDAYVSMADANLSLQKVNVSFKVVMTGGGSAKTLLKHGMFFYQELTDDKYPLVRDEQKEIVKKYMKLISAVRVGKYNTADFHLAPKPFTLEQKNLTEGLGVVSILKNYAVTDKADGERMLMYIDEKGEAYFINNIFQVMKVGGTIKTKLLTSSLLDGEFISSGSKKMFAIFDIYFMGGSSVMNLPLIDDTVNCRYFKMNTIADSKHWKMANKDISISVKEHIAANGKDMFVACKKILEKGSRPYNIDGLVFTPTDLPVFAHYPNQFKELTGKSTSWDKVFKWKPPEQNTIDFLVKEQDGLYIEKGTNRRYKRFKLFVGYNAAQWEEIPVWKGIQRVFSKVVVSGERPDDYKARVFKPIEHGNQNVSIAFIPINSAGIAITKENEVVEDDTIVEMSYTPDDSRHPSLCWTANRVREDKTKAYRTTGSITKTANDMSVALNIWHTIHTPVTVENIIGDTPVPFTMASADVEERMLGTNDIYYARDIPRNHMLSVHMLNFHNHGVKAMLYSSLERRDSLLELACGKAGDLPRWKEFGYKFILGVDLVRNNIEGSQASYMRFLNAREEYIKRNTRGTYVPHYPQAIFLIGDCALPLADGSAARGRDYDSEVLLKLLFKGKTTDKYAFLNRYHMQGKASKGFDMVSCQFAIHYFFKKSETLDGFLLNVSNNLKENGQFITTFMDGERVHNLINAKGGAEGKKHGATIWAIQKQYKTFKPKDPYGKLIDVYLENTNKFIPEYLVHYDVLVARAAEHGLVVHKQGFFDQTFAELYKKVETDDPKRMKRLDEDLKSLKDDTVQTQFSFLNRWVIFRKITPE